MNSFRSISPEQGELDGANLEELVLVPEASLLGEYDHWYGLLADKDRPFEYAKSVAAFCLEVSSQVLRKARLAAGMTTDNVSLPDIAEDVRWISANYALSRFMGALFVRDERYADAGEEYSGAKNNKKILDHHPETLRRYGAYALIVSAKALENKPFEEGEAHDLSDGGRWYYDEERGLYILAKSPPEPSAALMDKLTISTGSREGAENLVDAANSVCLLPYASIRSLKEAF